MLHRLHRCALAAACVALLGCSTPTTEAQMVHGSRLPSWKPTYAMPASTFMMVRPPLPRCCLLLPIWPAGRLLTRRRPAGLQQHGAVQHRVRVKVGHRGLCALHRLPLPSTPCPLPCPLPPSCPRSSTPRRPTDCAEALGPRSRLVELDPRHERDLAGPALRRIWRTGPRDLPGEPAGPSRADQGGL